jgi:hypothetical protein
MHNSNVTMGKGRSVDGQASCCWYLPGTFHGPFVMDDDEKRGNGLALTDARVRAYVSTKYVVWAGFGVIRSGEQAEQFCFQNKIPVRVCLNVMIKGGYQHQSRKI